MESSLWNDMMALGKAWFVFPGVESHLVAIAVAVAVVFGAIWVCLHWPDTWSPWLAAVAIASAFLTLGAIIFIQTPLQVWIGDGFGRIPDMYVDWLLLFGIPSLLVSGLVQEGAKMVPMVVWWQRKHQSISPATGLAIGAIAGAAFGIFEAFIVTTQVLGAGWTIQNLTNDGFQGISPFWERFFAIGLHTAVSALAGWGLAKGKGWQFFLIAAGVHTLFNYPVLLYQKWLYLDGIEFSTALVRVETMIAVIAVLAAAVVLWIRWTRNNNFVGLDYVPDEEQSPDDYSRDEVAKEVDSEDTGVAGTEIEKNEPS